ncbi:MAG: ion channel [Candidatus Eisenbacteria bacterium]|uniref:Transporter n=1 Tax=Eiseniibacteriota bacterium TaxID=2212470 RepID=A0A956M2M8_UNCEI|nr:hypothetical protein [Candidatus Eisenbacteria bacterium]
MRQILRPRPTDLGFGTQASAGRSRRLLHRDGTFNVDRRGFGLFASLHVYRSLLVMTWRQFFTLSSAAYLVINLAFAGIYVALGPAALEASHDGLSSSFQRAFFFSVETISTIGYGNIVPRGLPANLVVTVESFVGILLFALITGLVFARFARPVARIIYSRKALIAPYEGGEAFELRMVNGRNNHLVDVSAQMYYTRRIERNGKLERSFDELPLELKHIAFFALSWTLVHPIDESSPLWGVSPESLAEGDAEFLVLITAVDETFNQTVHSRTSYKPEDVVFGARFLRMFEGGGDGSPIVLHRDRLDELEHVDRPV